MSYTYAPSLKPNSRIDVADILRGIAIALQFVFCTWWMKHHRRGPFEQLWYNLTWLKK